MSTWFDPSFGLSWFTSCEFIEAVGVTTPYELLVGGGAERNEQTILGGAPAEANAIQTNVRCPGS